MTINKFSLKSWPLSRLLVPLLAFIMIIVGLISAEIMYQFETSRMREEAGIKTKEISRLVSSVAADAIIAGDTAQLDILIEQISKTVPSIHRLIFLDTAGNKIQAWNKKAPIERLYCMDHVIPINYRGVIYGTLRIRWNLIENHKKIDEHIIGMLIQTAILLLITTSIFMVFGRFFVLSPMKRVNNHLLATMNGRRNEELVFKGLVAKEFMDLRTSLNLFSFLVSEREASESKMKAIVDTAMDCIISIDEQGRVLDFNPASEKTFGYKKEEALGQRLETLIIPHALRSAHKEGMATYFKTGKGPVLGTRIEVEALHKDGRIFPVELAIEDAAGPEGTIFVAYLRDISQRKEVERELLAEKEKAEIANQTKSDFLAVMSHEIRTPLNGVVGILGLLDETKLDKEQQQYVTTGRDSAETLLTVINDILDFSKMEAGKLELENSSYDLPNLIESVREISRPQAEEKGLQLQTFITPSVPQWIESDPGRVRQILLNLVSNALKFTKEGRVNINISCPERRAIRGDHLKAVSIRFEVHDTGLGIPETQHKELFTEFTTLDASYARKFGGTGLGLSICKRLVEMMDGEIGFKSHEGEGSLFWFELPMKVVSRPIEDEIMGDYQVTRKRLNKASKKRLLLAEDNPTNVMVIKAILKKLSYKVDSVGNGAEAVSAVQNFPYDLVFMDVSMPEMDGLEATRIIRSLNSPVSEIPIVAMTAHAMQGFREKVLESGMDDYIRKPVRKERVMEVLEELLIEEGGNHSAIKNKDEALDKTTLLENVKNSIKSSDMDKPIDTDVLRRLANETDFSMMPELIDLFLEDAARRVMVIAKATKHHDLDTLEMECHTLGSSAAAYGASEMHSIAQEVEMLCQRVLNDAALETAARMPVAAEAVFTALRQYKQDKGWMVH